MKVTKEQAAVLQLCDAIELFQKERYISAITLAGAAEEVLAQLLVLRRKETGTPFFTAEELEADLFGMFEDFLGISNYHAYRHTTRNQLKHHGEGNKAELTANFRQVALNHIAGAIQNYRFLKDRFPEEKTILKFCLEIGIS